MKTKILSLLLVMCLVVGIMPLVAFAEEAQTDAFTKVELNNGGSVVWGDPVVAGTATRFVTTTSEGVIAEAKETDNWNIKLEYPANGTPTLTLRGATLKGAEDEIPLLVSGNVAITVVIETASTIVTGNKPALYITNFGITTVGGPGKLTITTTDAIGIYAGDNVNAGETIIKDADIDISVTGSSTNRFAIGFTGKDLTIDNSKIHFTSGGKTLGFWGYAALTKEGDEITKVEPTWREPEEDVERNLIIQNGSVITGNATGRQALGASGKVIIKDSTVELTTTGYFPVLEKKPVLEGEYTAFGGLTAKNPLPYNESKISTYKYLKIVPGIAESESTEATTVPTTPSTTPTTPSTAPTQTTTVPATTEGTVPTTVDGADQTPSNEETGFSGGTIAAIVIVAVLVLAGGAFMLLWFVIKPEWLMNLLKR